jgi:hypothetical protein
VAPFITGVLTDTKIWIGSAEVLKITAARVRNKRLAKFELDRLVRQGKLTARAKRCIRELDFCPITPNPPNGKITFNPRQIMPDKIHISIPIDHWKIVNRSMSDNHIWRWNDGIFAFISDRSGVMIEGENSREFLTIIGKRIVYYDVEFLKTDVDSAVKKLNICQKKQSTQISPRRKKWNFAIILKDIQGMILNGEVELAFGSIDAYGTQAVIEKYICTKMANEGDWPPETSVRRRARDLMQQWRTFIQNN